MKKLAAIALTSACLALIGSGKSAATWTVDFPASAAQTKVSAASDLAKQARAALAQTSGRIELAGLTKPVEVIRDSWGVAHIYAQTQEDLFFAQGFVAAQDRLWQMEIWRRTGEGRLAEVLGPSPLVRLLGTEKAGELLETDPFKKLEVPEGLDLNGIDGKILAGANAASGAVSFGSGQQSSEGSNDWVVSGALTNTGKPILANDPHRSIGLPSLRYLVHLVGPGWNVIGAGEPTLPGIAAGHNERVGFGFTIVGIDQQDLYGEETNTQDPTQNPYKDKWEKMTVEHEMIAVKDKPASVEVELRFT